MTEDTSAPLSSDPLSLADRILHEWSRARAIRVESHWVLAIDRAQDEVPQPDAEAPHCLLISGARAQTLGWTQSGDPHAVFAHALPEPSPLSLAHYLALARVEERLAHESEEVPGWADDLMALARWGRLVPAFLVWPATSPLGDAIQVSAAQLAGLNLIGAECASLEKLAEVPVPLAEIGASEFLLYRTRGLAEGPLAVRVGRPDPGAALVRLHSSCITGDIFGSQRCDWGPQLMGAMQAMREAGGGYLLYLFQEGRNTGLSAKLRAYGLQDRGLDTIDADATLGFGPDERDYSLAAAVLQDQGVTGVKLMTNNPLKVEALEGAGVHVVERVPLVIEANPHNARYLDTKAERAGHFLPHSLAHPHSH